MLMVAVPRASQEARRMADYSTQRGPGMPPNNYGHTSNFQRDVAFSSIFGAAPPPGRSQSITASPPASMPLERAQTMSSPTPRPMPPPQYQPYQPSRVPSGSEPAPRTASGWMPSHPQPLPHQLPQPLHPNRRVYPQPQRIDPRQLPAQHFHPGSSTNYYGAAPGLNADPYRSRSMANMPGPPAYGNQPFPQAPAHPFRHQPYHSMAARTTAQGRVVPERHDERAMSMTHHPFDRDHNQMMSGRVIPNRRREPDQQPLLAEEDPGHDDHFVPTGLSDLLSTLPGRTPSQTSVRSVATSMASTVVAPSERSASISQRSSVQRSTSNATASPYRRSPLVYPALLSRVADAFRERIVVGERAKNELTYKSAFTGSEAVDLVAYIIKTTDRNLALLLGRSLDAQKFFHDVTYDHRLRDSALELYQFRETLMDDSTDVNGVFTLLTECYSPTCTSNRLCYSIACPRRLEQQARLHLKPQPGLKRAESRASLHNDESDEQKLWINTVSKEVADSVGERERKRQEVICEIMYTERDFVKDLEYLRDFWMKPLRSTNPTNHSPVPEHRREKFVRSVFSNCLEVHAVNSAMARELTRRQDEDPVVRAVGDIFLRFIPRFEPFIKYGASQLYGKYDFERERASNPAFSKFVDETERLKESRKLELNGYLTKPTTRLARYPLLLENVVKYTADDNPDKKDIPQAIAQIRDVLSRVNVESGKAENHFNLMQLNQQLKFRQGEYVDLKLTEESRQLVFKGALKKSPTDHADVHVYLFDHAVLLVRVKVVNKREELKVYRKPIPLELLLITQMDEVIPRMGVTKRPSSSLMLNAPRPDPAAKQNFPITFKHLGKGGYELTLYAVSHVQRRKWMEHIEAQQSALRNRSNIFTKAILCDHFFGVANRVNCLVPIDGGRKLVFGTDNGIFISDRRPKEAASKPRRVLDVTGVTQVDVLEEYQLLLVLSNKTLISFPLEALELSEGQTPPAKRPRKIGHANFFKAGVCLSRHLVCCVKTSALSTTIKVYEPLESMSKGKKKPALSKMFQGGQDVLKPLKEIFIPSESSSIQFLKSILVIGCARGFEVVSLETLETQSLLDQADTSLDFVARKENVKPMHIERLNGQFLLNYTDFSFFVNRNGWRARPDWHISWEGQPHAFALSYPYILAFEPSFVEMRHLETSALAHILTAKNIRMLHASTREVLYAYEDEYGEDVIASLDFWSPVPKEPAAPKAS
ncbi:MAG: RHO1 GDP-GTP exchange protein 2 [Phylliscum demangeonii]|nr:MAG: RHO1 GDP-GTP exchange protein 2 [Phylliscum demangeonii]